MRLLESSNEVGCSGKTSEVVVATKKKHVNKSNFYDIMQCPPSHNLSSATSISSYVDLNNTREYSFISSEPSIQVQLESTLGHSQRVPLSERRNASVEVPLNDPRTLILPKVPPCKYSGAYKFYRESDSFCCSKGQICLAKSTLPPYLVHLITGVDAKSKEFHNMIRTYNNHFAFTSIDISCDEKYQHRDHGDYTVRVQEQIHHYPNDLIPESQK
ncbi:hypothetical protein LIER_06273 [Lithospermum erythrorhizon]|uniref:Uncharacterized protein n=1 Tax=Lithospermum erythrorhizon TaxID=34254 RepID=A0AAV3P3X2_LITER